ncbi:MAG: ABC transporter permease subunit [Roseomonas sp.]|nr:ABC transporter permease subunit [Roseomonas sp.]
MDIRDVYDELVRWTPFLAQGFVWNIVISVVAMLFGTMIGAILAFMRQAPGAAVYRTSMALTEVARNIPTFVFLFYIAFLIPGEIDLFGFTIKVPAWIKASLALSIAVVGYVSDTLSIVIRDWRAGEHESALLFLPSWTTYLLIIVMASSTASIIGVSEIVSRCNTVIAATGNSGMLVWIYLYAMLWFFVFCYPLIKMMQRIQTYLRYRNWASAKAGE